MSPTPARDNGVPRTLPFWILGTTVALGGALLVRVVAPRTSAPAPVTLAGFLLAILGIFVITVGTRRKYTYLARKDRENE